MTIFVQKTKPKTVINCCLRGSQLSSQNVLLYDHTLLESSKPVFVQKTEFEQQWRASSGS